MPGPILVQYLGFESKNLVREYAFAVLDGAAAPLHYALTIANDAFDSHRARYQDAPEICSLRLHRELEAHANHPPTMTFCISDKELAIFQEAHAPAAVRNFHKR